MVRGRVPGQWFPVRHRWQPPVKRKKSRWVSLTGFFVFTALPHNFHQVVMQPWSGRYWLPDSIEMSKHFNMADFLASSAKTPVQQML